ncbi:MAG: nucleotidyltransferase domain-containing protein [Gammaproteobacteria bacterium]|nr:nucleotidyltransferase domain-containing protein [Gammaproteobacteria bacterium]
MESINKILQQIISIAIEYQADQVILFGSRARGDAEEKSDIDVAILAPNLHQRAWLDLVAKTTEIETLLSIDVVRLDQAGEKLKERVKQEGKLLYEHN